MLDSDEEIQIGVGVKSHTIEGCGLTSFIPNNYTMGLERNQLIYGNSWNSRRTQWTRKSDTMPYLNSRSDKNTFIISSPIFIRFNHKANQIAICQCTCPPCHLSILTREPVGLKLGSGGSQ